MAPTEPPQVDDAQAPGTWPARLQPGAVRFGRSSAHYDETIAFYRDLVGVPVIGGFSASFEEDGTIFGLPDTSVQLEVIRAHQPPAAATFEQLVLYLTDQDAVDRATAELRAAGCTPVADPHPYWAANQAVTYRDPDDREVVFAPWVYGRDPEPLESRGLAPRANRSVAVSWHDGDRDELRPLFREAEDSSIRLDAYLPEGQVLVARRGAELVGHLQLVPVEDGAVELRNMAVVRQLRGTGIGRQLVRAALAEAGNLGVAASRLLVATAAADVGALRFYQRCGFRVLRVERDAFSPATGYPDPIVVDGVTLRDRVWLDQPLDAGLHEFEQ
jgi:predicted N-acetyltransferase YhbS